MIIGKKEKDGLGLMSRYTENTSPLLSKNEGIMIIYR